MSPFLTKSQVGALRFQHKQTRDGKVRDRIRAVLWANEVLTQVEIAHLLFLDETTVAQHIQDYKTQKN